MVFRRPTQDQVIARTDAEVQSRLGIGPLLRRSVLGVISRVMAGAAWSLFGYLDWVSRQVLPDTADGDQLQRWATIKGLSRKLAVEAIGPISLSGTDGSVVPLGTELRRADGITYATSAAATVAGGVAIVQTIASVAGVAGDAPAGTALTLASPLAGVLSQASVAPPGIGGGEDAETDEELRARLVQALSFPPHGGAEADYVRWTLEVPGVTRAWAFKAYLGLGTVGVTFAVDDDPAGPIPTTAQVDAVEVYLEDGRRPVTADLFVFAPVPMPVDFVVSVEPDLPDVRTDVEASLADLFARDVVPGQVLPLSQLNEAISTAAGETDHQLRSPTADVTPPRGSLPTLGTVTWQ
jgi:uncharacterized phage protein gp47/JayE